MPVTGEPLLDLYPSVLGVGNGSTLPVNYYGEIFSPTISGICEIKAVGSGMSSSHLKDALFTVPGVGDKTVVLHDSFTSYWDCCRSWTGDQVARPWLKSVLERMKYLQSLPAQWDSHRAQPILDAAFSRALTFLNQTMAPGTPAPSIVPLESGGVQVEWHRAGFDVEIEFDVPQGAHIYVYELSSQNEWEGADVASLFVELGLSSRLAAGYDPANVA